ncbi:MAG: inosine guanosine and xanthosine phosphorylase family [Ferruginibacter sp.]|nr:inosine guanosine and xanthosine phosphorylase family [Ferruginibacter sp.]
MLENLEETAAFLAGNGFDKASTGIVLGTGLGELLNSIVIEKTIPYNEIPHFPVSTVEFHKGNLLLGKIGDTTVMAMQGRFHYYEGYSMQQVTFPIRLMKMLGIQHLLLSNAAGGMNIRFKKGDLVIIEDHINMQTENPLRGLNNPVFGPRFPDMSCPYNKLLNERLRIAAEELGIKLQHGVYVAVNGPNLETRAEYKYLAAAGADMVGMSTVPEVIVANQIGLPCAAISVITDECDPDNLQPVDIAEIIAVAGEADKTLSSLFVEMIRNLGIGEA